MKTIFILLMAVALAGCQTTLGDIDAAIQKTAPQVCAGAVTAHDAFVATGLGGDREKAIVEAAWSRIAPLCDHPTTITAAQLVVVTAQVGVIINTMRSVKANG